MDRDWLYRKYIVEGLSTREVAKDAGCSSTTVLRYLRKYSIPSRTKSEALRGEKNPMFGVIQGEEIRRKKADATRKWMAEPARRKEYSRRFSGKGNPMYGRSHSVETRRRLSEREFSLETRARMSKSAKKRASTPEFRERMSTLAKTRTQSRNPFYGRKHSEETKLRLRALNTGRFRGENGSNWQGGRTPLNAAIRSMGEYKDWRKAVLIQDDYTCTWCGQRGRGLHVDHIEPLTLILRKNNVSLVENARRCADLWDVRNGRTLCVTCHRKTDTYAGRALQGVSV